MKRLVLVFLAALFAANAASAQAVGVGVCAFPNCTGGSGTTLYTPTTGSDWADPDPTTISGALDHLASEKLSTASAWPMESSSSDPTPTTAPAATCTSAPCFWLNTTTGKKFIYFGSYVVSGVTEYEWQVASPKDSTSVRSAYPWATSCDATYGCPDQNGTILIDPGIAWIGVNGRRDDDASIWGETGTSSPCAANPSGTKCVNNVYDFIPHGQSSNTSQGITGVTITLTGSTAQWGTTLTVGPTAEDTKFCRYNNGSAGGTEANFAPCSTTSGSDVCTSTIQNANHPELLICLQESSKRYFPVPVIAYNGCNTAGASNTFTLRGGSPAAFSASDTCQVASVDGTHPSAYYQRWLAQTILNTKEEWAFYPRKNLFTNGSMETSCTNSTTDGLGPGWYKSNVAGGTTGGTMATTAVDPTSVSTNGEYGKSCILYSRAAVTDNIQSNSVTVVPGKVYAFHMAIAAAGASAGTEPLVQVIDMTGSAVMTAANWKVWHVLGSTEIEWTSGQGNLGECYNGCIVAGEFLVPSGTTSVAVRLRNNATTANSLNVDEAFLYESPTQRLGLDYMIPPGRLLMYALQDSRGNPNAGYAGLGDAVANITSFNTIGTDGTYPATAFRPDLSFVRPLTSSRYWEGGMALTNVVAGLDTNLSLTKMNRSGSDLGVVYLGVNDLNGDQNEAQYIRDIRKITDSMKQNGIRPIVLLEPPYKGDTAARTFCETGTSLTGSGDSAANCISAGAIWNRKATTEGIAN